MLSLERVTKTRALLLPQPLVLDHALLAAAAAAAPQHSAPSLLHAPQRAGVPDAALSTRELVLSFAEWFRSGNNSLFDRIFEILGSSPDDGRGPARLGALVAGPPPDGAPRAGRPRLRDEETRRRAALPQVLRLGGPSARVQNYFHRIRFNDTLVMGYAVAGKPEFALQLFGKMRFRGLDLDTFAYHVFLNALVEESCFDAVEMVTEQISLRGLRARSRTRS
ncbi:hypothetical protein NL676_015064 [Syzygium grande]|nr:hypothetical protein NL676_015064 [Syzygium grande]